MHEYARAAARARGASAPIRPPLAAAPSQVHRPRADRPSTLHTEHARNPWERAARRRVVWRHATRQGTHACFMHSARARQRATNREETRCTGRGSARIVTAQRELVPSVRLPSYDDRRGSSTCQRPKPSLAGTQSAAGSPRPPLIHCGPGQVVLCNYESGRSD